MTMAIETNDSRAQIAEKFLTFAQQGMDQADKAALREEKDRYFKMAEHRLVLAQEAFAMTTVSGGMTVRTTKKMRVVREPNTWASVLKPRVLPAFRAEGNTDLTCGTCNAVIIEGEEAFEPPYGPDQFLVICVKCGDYNLISDGPGPSANTIG